MRLVLALLLLCLVNAKIHRETFKDGATKKYKPIWEDLDTRPLPEWYDRAKIGIFIHWGVYSVPSFGSEWFWYGCVNNSTGYVKFMMKNYPPGFTYQQFAPMFTAEFFDANQWADLFAKSGAKYVVLTTKHHDGYTLYPSKRSFSWNSVDVGPRRDIVKEVSKAVRGKGLKFGAYHSLYEWFNPMYLEDKRGNFTTRNYPDSKLWPDVKQLVNDYQPSMFWSDGSISASADYWNSTGLIAWLYNDSPVKDEVVVNDRWGKGTSCKHGDFFNCYDHYNPGVLQKHKWENAFTIDKKKAYCHRRNLKLSEVMTIEELLKEIISTISCGGNALINIGPTKEGTIIPIFQERLLALGTWLGINGQAIYGSSPWKHQNDTRNPDVWYTCTKSGYDGSRPTAVPGGADRVTAVFALVLKWPKDGVLRLRDVAPYLHSENYKATLLGNEESYLDWTIENGVAYIKFPDMATVKSKHAWTVKFSTK